MRQEMKRFKWHIGTLAFVYALTNVFIQPYVVFLGLDAAQYSVFQALNVFVLAFSQFLFGYLCDKFQTIRHFLKTMMLLVMGMGVLIFVSQSFLNIPSIILLCLLLLLQFFQGPLLTLTENWIMLSPKRLSLFFGNIRMFASLTWGISCFVFGIILVGTKIQYLPLLVACFYIFPFLIHSHLNDISNRRMSSIGHIELDAKLSSDEKTRLGLFCLFGLTAFLFFLSGRYFSFLGFLFSDVGIDSWSVTMYIGATVALMALSEMPLFHLGKKVIEKIGPARLFFIAIIASLIRVLIMKSFPNAFVYIGCGLMQGIIYPAYLLSLRSFSKTLVATKIFNTVFGVFTLILTLGDMAYTLFLGTYVKQHQMDFVYFVCIGSALLSILFFMLFKNRMNAYTRTILQKERENEALPVI